MTSPAYLKPRELATLLGITEARVSQLRKQGIIAKHGRVFELTAVTDYINFLRGKNPDVTQTGGRLDKDQEQARQAKANADKLELQNAVTRGELAPVGDMAAAVSQVYGKQIAIFDSLPANIKRACPELSARGLEVVKKEVAKVRNIAADQLPD